MTLDIRRLARGDVLPSFSLCVTAHDVRAYLEATGEVASPSATLWSDTVPPLALGAFALSALMERLPLAPGTLHAGQDFEFHRAVSPGEELRATVTVEQRTERRGSLLTTLALALHTGDGLALSGRTTIVQPAESGTRGEQ